MQTFDWAMEEVVAAHPDLYLDHCVAMAAAVLGQPPRNTAQILVTCEGIRLEILQREQRFRAQVRWSEATAAKAERVRQTEQVRPMIERASVALAALVFGKLVPDGRLRVTREGDHADYWLPGLNRALEISGTMNARELHRRHREKARQVLQNPLGWNGYAFVVCFTAPVAQVLWSYHVQQGSIDGK